MAAPKYLKNNAGRKTEVAAITSSAGAADAEKIVATAAGTGILADSIMGAAETGNSVVVKTKSDGTLDSSILPAGIGADTASIVASENLAAGDVVNIWNDGGTPKVRKADATAEGKEAHGFVLAGVASAASATVYFEGKLTGLSGLTPGARHYISAATPGAITSTAPSATGNVVQFVGTAYSSSAINFEAAEPITVA
jgi:hypothetical protein